MNTHSSNIPTTRTTPEILAIRQQRNYDRERRAAAWRARARAVALPDDSAPITIERMERYLEMPPATAGAIATEAARLARLNVFCDFLHEHGGDNCLRYYVQGRMLSQGMERLVARAHDAAHAADVDTGEYAVMAAENLNSERNYLAARLGIPIG